MINSGKPKLGIVEAHSNPITGEVMWLQTGKVPYRYREGNIIGVIAFAMDISNQKKIEEELRSIQARLENQQNQMERVHEFLRSTLEQPITSVNLGATKNEILKYLLSAQQEFMRMAAPKQVE